MSKKEDQILNEISADLAELADRNRKLDCEELMSVQWEERDTRQNISRAALDVFKDLILMGGADDPETLKKSARVARSISMLLHGIEV